jgi:hypothetical protein
MNKAAKGNHLDNFVSREHQWIFGSSRFPIFNNKTELGPGSYNIIKK